VGRLEELSLCGNDSLGDEGIRAIMEGIHHHHHHHHTLKRLDISDVGMNSSGALSLAHLGLPSLPHLEELKINRNGGIGDEVIATIITSLQHHCHHLTTLSAWNAGVGPVGGSQLVEALRYRSWPHLQEISIRTASVGEC